MRAGTRDGRAGWWTKRIEMYGPVYYIHGAFLPSS